MNFLQLNKIIAYVLIAVIIALVSGVIAKFSYRPLYEPFVRGYIVEITGGVSASGKKEVNILELIASASAADGEKVAKQCLQCHVFEKGGANKIGPSLWGIVGKKQASKPDFAYSNAFKTLNGTWDYENLAKFINAPSRYIKGTKMSFAGLKKPQDLANVIAYLRENSDSKYPLPKIEAKKVEGK